jgi:hypothetical protein
VEAATPLMQKAGTEIDGGCIMLAKVGNGADFEKACRAFRLWEHASAVKRV